MMVRGKPLAALAAGIAALAASVPAATASATTRAPGVAPIRAAGVLMQGITYSGSQPSGPNSPTCDKLRFPTEQAVLYGAPAVADSLVQAYVSAGCGPPPPI